MGDKADRMASSPTPPREEGASGKETRGRGGRTMIPGRERRRLKAESVLMRFVATGGIVGFGVLLGAILVSQDVQGWIVGLVVALVSVITLGHPLVVAPALSRVSGPCPGYRPGVRAE